MKFKLIILLFILSFSFSYFRTYAQVGSEITDVDVLKEQDEVLINDYPHVFKKAKIESVKPLNDKHSIVAYFINGNYFEAVVNSDRKDLLLIATCKQIRLNDLPDIVKDSFKKEPQGSGEIVRAFEVTTPTSSVFYRIDTYKSGTARSNDSPQLVSYFFNHFGQFQTPPY